MFRYSSNRCLNERVGPSVSQLRMPPSTYEVRHYHNHSRQFFFVLSGTATLEVDGVLIELYSQEGYEISPLVPHQMFNKTNQDVL